MFYKKVQKSIALVALFTLFFTAISVLFDMQIVEADSTRTIYTGSNLDTAKYPGYKDLIDNLKKAHPNWVFKIMYTELDWNQTITSEASFSGSSPYSLISYHTGEWIDPVLGYKSFDNGSWYHPSNAAIAYYMDPRNWLYDNGYLLQFLEIGTYPGATDQQILSALKGSFLDNLDYAKAINNACRNKGANPYYIIARIIQEQGMKGSGTINMNGGDGKKYFNVFNINASGNSSSAIISNALAYAKKKGWDTLQKSLEGGIDEIFSSWLSCKQDTMYLNKFDVEAKGGTLTHQYMQNIEAPHSESMSMYNKLKDTGILNNALTFVIPVFKNMPSYASPIPSSSSVNGPKNIKLKSGHTDWNVRASASTDAKVVATIKNDQTIVLSSQRDNNGWHRVVLTDGTVGYIKFDSSAWEETSDVTNCNEDVSISTDKADLRAGPASSEKVLTTLSKGQIVSRVDNTGRYTYGGVTWDRVIMNDGTKGFVQRSSLDTNPAVYRVKVSDCLRMRSAAGFSGEVIRLLPNDTKLTRLEIASSMIDGYYWDKVITGTGITGYVARSYLIDVNGNAATGSEVRKAPAFTPSPMNKVGSRDTTNNTLKVEPNVSVKEILDKYTTAVIKDKSGKQITDKSVKVGTGYTITVEGKTYTIIKFGDADGDGLIDSADLLKIVKHLKGIKLLDIKLAGDATNDGTVDSADLLRIVKYLKGTANITL